MYHLKLVLNTVQFVQQKLIKELVDNLEEFKLTELEYSEKDTKKYEQIISYSKKIP